MIDQGTIRAMIKRFTGPLAALIPTGTASATTYLRGDGAWVDPFPNGRLRARLNFNGTGVVAIRSASNVDSITDGGVGNYVINLTAPEPDANYAVVGLASNGAFVVLGALTTTSFAIATVDASGAAIDPITVCLAVFR